MSIHYKHIHFRNALYQGYCRQSSSYPAKINNRSTNQAPALILHQNMKFLFSENWNINYQACKQTVVFWDNGQFLYGSFKDGLQQGMNVIQKGDTRLFGIFHDGKLKGKFVIQKQNIILVCQMNEQMAILEKKQFIKYDELKSFIKQVFSEKITLQYNKNIISIQQEHFSFIKYLKKIVNSTSQANLLNQEKLSLTIFDQTLYKFGYQNGLSVIFDDDYYIYKMGYNIDSDTGYKIGKIYNVLNKNIEQGNFQTKQTYIYKDVRPTKQLNKFWQKQFKRKGNFDNRYFQISNIGSIFQFYDAILKQCIFQLKIPNQLKFIEFQGNQNPLESKDNQKLGVIRRCNNKSPARIKKNQSYSHLKKIKCQIQRDLKIQKKNSPNRLRAKTDTFQLKQDSRIITQTLEQKIDSLMFRKNSKNNNGFIKKQLKFDKYSGQVFDNFKSIQKIRRLRDEIYKEYNQIEDTDIIINPQQKSNSKTPSKKKLTLTNLEKRIIITPKTEDKEYNNENENPKQYNVLNLKYYASNVIEQENHTPISNLNQFYKQRDSIFWQEKNLKSKVENQKKENLKKYKNMIEQQPFQNIMFKSHIPIVLQ